MSPELHAKVTQIIKPLIPADAEDRVARTVKLANTAIRDVIRSETGLRLSDDQTRSSIPVKVTDGFSNGLAGLIGKYNDPVLWRIIAAQARLGSVLDGLNFLLTDWNAFELWPQLPPVAKGSRAAIEKTVEVAHALQQVVLTKQVTNELKVIEEDILGAYHFRRAHPQNRGWLSVPPWIEIYWMPMALISSMLGVRIEDLTVVILAHELAHGYTHMGKDIDGNCWDDGAFGSAATPVVEGLAQFYTELATNRLRHRFAGAFTAYEKLLELQSGPYLAHREWHAASKAPSGETVRFAMLSARGVNHLAHEHWKKILEETTQKLSRKGSGQTNLFSP
jgi:hypothetical protein